MCLLDMVAELHEGSIALLFQLAQIQYGRTSCIVRDATATALRV